MKQLFLVAESEPAFSLEVPRIEGLALARDFISELEERALLEAVDGETWNHDWKRRRQIYGVSYGPAGDHPKAAASIPIWIAQLAERVIATGQLGRDLVNAVVNDYAPGEGIAMHYDYPGFERVAAVSIGGGVLLELDKPNTGEKAVLDVPPRSLWTMHGEARHEWRHGIAARKTDAIDGRKRARARRVSITMRSR